MLVHSQLFQRGGLLSLKGSLPTRGVTQVGKGMSKRVGGGLQIVGGSTGGASTVFRVV